MRMIGPNCMGVLNANESMVLLNSTALVDVSITVAPALTCAKTLCSPNITSRTCTGPGNDAMTTSACAAPSAKLLTQVAPNAIKLSALARDTSNTVTA